MTIKLTEAMLWLGAVVNRPVFLTRDSLPSTISVVRFNERKYGLLAYPSVLASCFGPQPRSAVVNLLKARLTSSLVSVSPSPMLCAGPCEQEIGV